MPTNTSKMLRSHNANRIKIVKIKIGILLVGSLQKVGRE